MTPIEKAKAKDNALRTLGVGVQASNKELRAAWKRKAFENHPDRRNGDDTRFQAVRSAYEYLSTETGQTSRNTPPAQSEPVHKRAVIKTRIEDLTAKSDTLSNALAGEREQKPAEATEHVPCAVRRRGRKWTYIIKAALEEGTNRVAIPVSTGGKRKSDKATIVSFKSPKVGAGKIKLPEEIRESAFPGARQVRIQFESDEPSE